MATPPSPQVFDNVLLFLALLSIIYLLVRLRPRYDLQLIPMYLNFILFATITFVFVVISSLANQAIARDTDGYKVYTIVQTIIVGSQWFIQIAITVFMFQMDTEGRAVMRTVIISSITSVLFTVATFVPLLIDLPEKSHQFMGYVIVESIEAIGFALAALTKIWPRIAPRPACLEWSIFQAITHVLYSIIYIFHVAFPRSRLTQCSSSFTNVVYYALYAFLLYRVVIRDTSYWRKKGALLQHHSIQANERFPLDAVDRMLEAGVSLIPWKDLKVKVSIGNGNYGEVFLATWKGTSVAVKKFKNPDPSVATGLMDSLLQESILFSRLRHPNLVLFLGICTEEPNVAMITEYMPNGSLWHLIHSQAENVEARLPWKRRIKILLDIARGMVFLHNCTPKIIHRDLKTPNVLLGSDWTCKVCDFGLSRTKTQTTEMSRVGTPHWMAPEVLREENYSEKADIYSFGVIIWELVTLQRPYNGCSPLRIVYMVAHQGQTLPIPDNCPPDLAALMRRCWLDAQERPSFDVVLDELESIKAKGFANDKPQVMLELNDK